VSGLITSMHIRYWPQSPWPPPVVPLSVPPSVPPSVGSPVGLPLGFPLGFPVGAPVGPAEIVSNRDFSSAQPNSSTDAARPPNRREQRNAGMAGVFCQGRTWLASAALRAPARPRAPRPRAHLDRNAARRTARLRRRAWFDRRHPRSRAHAARR